MFPSVKAPVICRGHTFGITDIAFSPDSGRLVSASVDGTLRLWDTRKGQALRPFIAQSIWPVQAVDWSPDGKWISAGDGQGRLRVWDAERGTLASQVQQPEGPPQHGDLTALRFSPEGIALVSGTRFGQVRLWNLHQEGQVSPLHMFMRCGPIASLGWSPDGQQIACATGMGCSVLVPADDTSVTLAAGMTVKAVAWSPDGCLLAGSAGQQALVWDMASGVEVSRFCDHTAPITSVVWSPDGQRVASGSDDHTIQVWEARTGRRLCAAYRGHLGPVLTVAWSPDGRHIASGSQDGTVHLWEPEKSA